MSIGPQCWTCRRDRVQCDSNVPDCTRCRNGGLECLGYDGADSLEVVRGDSDIGSDTTNSAGSSDVSSGSSEPFTSDQILDISSKSSVPVFRQPTPALYRKAQMIFEGLDYFNKMICPDLVSLESHFNPYRVNLQRVDRIPDIYVKVLVSTAGFHRLMSHGPEPTPSSALIQKDVDVFQLRIEALRGVNEQLSQPEQQTSDATLLCVLSLMIASIQASAYTEWRSHLEGARRIIQLRGGLKKILTDNPYFKPVMTFFILIDVMGSTTTSSAHKDMAVATTMAMKYWEIEPGILQFLATTTMPCPDELFRVIVLINYLRTITRNHSLRSKRQVGTRMVIAKLLAFSPTAYASRMQRFNGWATNGKEIRFSPAPSPARSASSSEGGQESENLSPSTELSRASLEGELWLSVAIIYRTSTLLYALRTLVIDINEEIVHLLPENAKIDVDTLRSETRQTLSSSVEPVFKNPITMHQIGKLILWPLFILGMETDYTDMTSRKFLTNGFSALSTAMGTLGPLGAIDALGVKWKIDAEKPPESRVTWDDYFQGREDYIVF